MITCAAAWTMSFLWLAPAAAAPQVLGPGFQPTGPFDEQVRWSRLASGVRIMINAPATLRADRRLLVIFATPNGNTIEQTLGCAASQDVDWRYDLQHVAAQIRRLREADATRDIVLAVVQAPQLSWPAFRREQRDAGAIIRDLVASLGRDVAADRIVLAGHSGGGSFLFGYVHAVDTLPAEIERIVFLDANYSYSDDERHGDKLLAWLRGDAHRQLVVIAYDDREITLNGKRVVGPDGGTFRASQRMLGRFRRGLALTEQQAGEFQHTSGLAGQIQFFIHPNPANKILHTALVGDMNGLLQGLTLGTDCARRWGQFGGPRAYGRWIQPQPSVDLTGVRAVIPTDAPQVRWALPDRPGDAPTGTQFREQILNLARGEREAAILREITRGNVPDSLRTLTPIRVEATDPAGVKLVATYFVTCDYLAVGHDDDFFRVPMSPRTAAAIADATRCSLITARISDDVFAAAPLKLAPKPLTKDRDAAATFFVHHQIIEEQLRDKPRGRLVAGIKKDVVLTKRLAEKPHRTALYGWHYPDGRPIQPLYVGHVDWYVDYSHGIRLMADQVLVENRSLTASQVLQNPRLHVLLSNEGPLDPAALRKAAAW
jgi:hypothetical protein